MVNSLLAVLDCHYESDSDFIGFYDTKQKPLHCVDFVTDFSTILARSKLRPFN